MPSLAWIAIALIVLLGVAVLLFLSLGREGPRAEDEENQQAVYLHLRLSNDEFGTDEEREAVFDLEDKLEPLLAAKEAGYCDGNEFGGGFAILFFYGADADALEEVIMGPVRSFGPRTGSYLIKQYGQQEDAKESRVEL